MEVDISTRPSLDDTNYLLSSSELSQTSQISQNVDFSQLSTVEITKDEARLSTDLSISCTESERAGLEGEHEYETSIHLNTITEENTSAISLLDASEEYNQTTTTIEVTTKQSGEFSEVIENQTELCGQLVDERAYFKSNLVELARRLWMSSQDEQHYTKGCLWSPDGTCVLVPVHLDGMHVMELPRDLYNINEIKSDRELSELVTAVHVKEGGTVYDYAWYPFMNSEVPESCCWLATRQHEPIHLWDAFTGELRCSYRGYDQVDEVEAAISVIFSNDGEKVIGGYKKSIKVFDTNNPGRDYISVPVKKAVSCFAFTPQSDLTVTTGSWNGYIDHYDLRTPKFGSLFTLGYHTGGITWLKYSKTEPVMLFSGARRDNKLLQWDMRNYKEPLWEFKRNVATNQRIYFDLSPQEEWLVSGDSNGLLHIWDLTQPEPKSIDVCLESLNSNMSHCRHDWKKVLLHNDCCNGVNFHPTLPILATSAGQYHFVDVANDIPETENTERKIVNYENSVLFLLLNAVE